MEFNRPLIVRKAARHPGSLPKRWGMLEVSQPNVVLSALKPGREGSVVMRVFEAAGRATAGASVRFTPNVQSAEAVDALERPAGDVKLDKDAVSFDLHPFEIKAVRVRLTPLAQEKR
jgi:alpha-mannosidase